MVIVGFSEVIGSWGMRATSSPRTARISRSSRAARSRPSRVTEPPVRCPLLGSSRMMDSPVVDFPQPDSPTTPTHSPSDDVERDAVDGHHGSVAEVEFGAQITQLEHGGHGESVATTPRAVRSPRGRVDAPAPGQTVTSVWSRSEASMNSSTMEKTTSFALRTVEARPMTWPHGLKFTSLACSG